jgi:hypothetical protein
VNTECFCTLCKLHDRDRILCECSFVKQHMEEYFERRFDQTIYTEELTDEQLN